MSKEYSAGEKIFAKHLNEIVRSGGLYGASAVGTDSYAITVSPAPNNLTAGDVFRFKADVANTGACTLKVNTLGAKSIKKNVSEDLITGEILAGQLITVEYDGTNFQLISIPEYLFYGIIFPSDTLLLSADTERTGTDLTYTKKKEMKVVYSGTYRVKFDLKNLNGNRQSYGKIYKNGVAFGIEHFNESNVSYTTYSEDLSFVAGDTVELWNKVDAGGDDSYMIRNFRIYGDKTKKPSVITD